MPRTDVSLRMVPQAIRSSPGRTARCAEEAERGGAEVHQGLVEALQREPGAPVLPGPLAQLEDLELAPGVPAVGRVEGGAAGLGQRGRAGQVGVRLEPARRLLRPSSPRCARRWRRPAGSPGPAPPARRRSRSGDRRRRSLPPRIVPRRSAPSPRRTRWSARLRRTSEVSRRSARPWEKCPGATSCTAMPGSVVALKTSSHSSFSRFRPGLLGRGDVEPGRAVRLAGRGRGHHRHRPAARLGRRADQADAVVVGDQVAFPGERRWPARSRAGPRRSRPPRPGARGPVRGPPPGPAGLAPADAHPSASRASSRSRSASACSASRPRSTGRASALLISAVSAGPPSAGSGSPSGRRPFDVRDQPRVRGRRPPPGRRWRRTADRRADVRLGADPGRQSAHGRPSSARATGALTWSRDSMAASTTRGQAARCSARAASRSAAGAYSRS